MLLILAASAGTVHAEGGLADMFRSLTGALGGGQAAPPPKQELTATIGVRGMDEADAKAVAPANEDYALMEGWAATKPEAERVAAGKGLSAQAAVLKPAKNAPAGN